MSARGQGPGNAGLPQDEGARELRRRAEESAREKAPELPENRGPIQADEAKRLLYELRVHQIELEMQNDELRRTQVELEEARTKFSDLFDLAPTGYLSLGGDGLIQEANLTAARQFGVVRSSLIGKPLTSFILPEDQDIYYLYRKHDAKADVSQECELRLKRSGADPFWARLEAILGTDDDGSAVCRLVISDISIRKTAEAGLLTLQRLESLGTLAGGIAHDFNNILTGVLGNLSLLHAHLKDGGGKLLDHVVEAEQACDAAKGLTRQLRTFATGGSPVVSLVDLRTVLTQSAGLAVRGSRALCLFELPEHPLLVDVDQGQIYQSVQNLVLNAAQAMPEGGEITVSAAILTLAPGEVPPLAAGRYVRVRIRDQGCGIAPEHLPRIFDPYFSTKSDGRGLGLAITHSIITKHGGHIGVQSAPGAGTTFTLLLPVSPLPPARPSAPPPAISVETGDILIMEDEPVVARTLKAMLEHLGYRTVVVGDGRAAIDAYRRQREAMKPFDGVIMDLTIPGGMGGREAVAELLKLYPDARVILSSGYSSNPVMADWAAHGFSGVLEKPYRLEDVAGSLRKILRPAPGP